jgi:hypothetical protein
MYIDAIWSGLGTVAAYAHWRGVLNQIAYDLIAKFCWQVSNNEGFIRVDGLRVAASEGRNGLVSGHHSGGGRFGCHTQRSYGS